jgi:hypothetical protein
MQALVVLVVVDVTPRPAQQEQQIKALLAARVFLVLHIMEQAVVAVPVP